MKTELSEKVEQKLQENQGEMWGDIHVLPLFDLESGGRFGLDADARWVIKREDHIGIVPFGPSGERHFVELLETPRADIEQLVEARARHFDLPMEAALLSIPSIDLVRSVLRVGATHYTRLGLLWLIPSELRALRSDIVAVATNPRFPRVIKDIAQRLTVPE